LVKHRCGWPVCPFPIAVATMAFPVLTSICRPAGSRYGSRCPTLPQHLSNSSVPSRRGRLRDPCAAREE
jgi:hypothetical protein